MSKRKSEIDPIVTDPTVPVPTVTLKGVEYKLALDFASLAQAESTFNRQGHNVNILLALPSLNLNSVRILWPCAIHKYHPEVSFEQAQDMVDITSIGAIVPVIGDVWNASLPEPEPGAKGNAEASE